MRVVLVVPPPYVVVVLVAVVALVVVAIADVFAIASDSVGDSGGDAPTAAEAAAKDGNFIFFVRYYILSKICFFPFKGQRQQRRPRQPPPAPCGLPAARPQGLLCRLDHRGTRLRPRRPGIRRLDGKLQGQLLLRQTQELRVQRPKVLGLFIRGPRPRR